MPDPIATPMRSAFCFGHGQSGIRDGLHGRTDAVMDEGIHLLDFFGGYVLRRIEVAHRAAEAHRECRHVEVRDRADAAAPGQDITPGFGDGITHRRDNTQSGNHNATLRQVPCPLQKL